MSKTATDSSSYQGLSRAYRPQTFSSVIGQEAIVTTLKNAIRLKKTAHAYLFCGTRGTGKTTLARVLAKALNCKNLSEECEPCNQCPSCLDVSQGRNLNVLEIDGASNRGIDDIRQLNETVGYAPSEGGCKIFLIDEAHMLTKEAFNALLKTLEEPPPNVKFFLATTEPHKIPPTILSRCQRFDLQRIPASKIAQKLTQIVKDQSIPYEEEAIHLLAGLSDGSMRVGESLLDQILCFSEGPLTTAQVSSSLSVLPSDPFFAFDEAFEKENLAFAFTWASAIFSSGKDLSYFLDCLLEHYRNILTIQLKIPLQEIPPSLQEKYAHSANIYTQEQTLHILDYLIEWHQQASKTPFKRISLEMILLHLLKSKYRVSAADLVCRLQEMQKTPFQKETTSSNKIPEPPKAVPKEPPAEEKSAPLKPREVIKKEPNAPPSKQVDSPQPIPIDKNTQIKHDTLMRFASIELEGLLTKQS